MIVFAGRVAMAEVPSKTVEAGITVAEVIKVPGIVVVIRMTEPSCDAGMALPTPVPVNCGGTDSVDVFGFSLSFFE